MASSTLPPFKHILPRFTRPPPNFKSSFRYRRKIPRRASVLTFFLIVIILSSVPHFCQRQNNSDKPPLDSHTTVTFPLAEAALHHFRNNSNYAARTTKLFKNDKANVRILIETYRIPPVFVSRLGPEGRTRLLARLTAESNGVPIWQTVPKILVIDLQNGLGNRLRALASAMEFAFVSCRVLVVLWAADAHIGARITDLFDPQVLENLIFIEQAIPWPINRNHIPKSAKGTDCISPISATHPAASSFQYFNFMAKDDGFMSPTNRHIRYSTSAHLYIKTAYLIQSQYMRHKLLNVFLQALTPSAQVMQLVHSVERRIGGPNALRGMIGVHLRSRTIVHDNDAVDPECEYSVDGAQITDTWRKMSTPKQFIPEMKRVEWEWSDIGRRWSSGLKLISASSAKRSIAAENSGDDPADISPVEITAVPKFFVCVDSVDTLDELAAHFPRNRLVTLPRECDDRGPQCVIHAFADIVLLSRTGAMLASGWSSFSEVALRMRVRPPGIHPSSNAGYHVRKSGYDFGKPSQQEMLMRRIGRFLRRMLQAPYAYRQRTFCRERHLNGPRR